jgi:hypothetical protein
MTPATRLLFSLVALTLISACATEPEISTGTSTKPSVDQPPADAKRSEPAPPTASAPPLTTVVAPAPAAPATPQVDGKGSQALATGLGEYENGKYESAAKTLRSAIVLGLNTRDLVNDAVEKVVS